MADRIGKVITNKKPIGLFNDTTKTFSKKVSRRKHFMRKLHSWGIQESAIMAVEKHGCKRIVIHDKDDGMTYEVSFEAFLHEAKTGDYGHGKQMFLHHLLWDRTVPDDGQLDMLDGIPDGE